MKTALDITGMHCASCATLLTDVLKDLPGVSNATVDFASGRAVVEHNPAKASPGTLRKAIEAEGYGARA